MRLLALSDTHGKHRLLGNLPEADVIIHSGDVTTDGQEHSAEDFMRWFSKLDYKFKVFIAGNHDFYFEQESKHHLRKMIPANIHYLNDSGITINGIRIWGSPITPWYFGWAFNRERGKSISKHWKLIPPDTDILVTHGPPRGILDQVSFTTSAGCEELLKRVEKISPKVHVFGHIHAARGLYASNSTRFINASIVDDNYNIRNTPILFEY